MFDASSARCRTTPGLMTARIVTLCVLAAAVALPGAYAADVPKAAAPVAAPKPAAPKPAAPATAPKAAPTPTAAKPAAPAAGGSSGAMPTNIWDGIYTNAQAKRGDVLYAQHCAMCHMVDMGGKEPAPELAGDTFLSKWYGHDVGELYERVVTTMPAGNPGILKPVEYADLVALLLQANNFKAGTAEVKPDAAALAKIKIKKKGT